MPAAYLQIGEDQISENLLAAIVVEQELNAHWTCRIRFRAVLDARPEVEDLQGKTVKLSTFSLLGEEHVLFSGMVVEAARTSEVWGSYTAEITAYAVTWAMDRSPRFGYFRKQGPAAIAATLGKPYGVAVDGAIAGDANLTRVQWGESDFRFLLRLIDDGEAWLRPAADGTGVETRTAFASGPTLQWREGEYGLNELTLRGRLRPVVAAGAHYDPNVMTSRLYGGTAAKAEFYDSAAPLVAVATGGSGLPEAYAASRSRSATHADYEQRLEMESRRGQANAVEVIGVSRSPDVQAGNEVTIAGMEEADGTYGVVRCVHRWTNQGYENEFTAVPVKRWFAADRVLAPEVEGLHPARVVDHDDPHNQGRIRVQYYWQETGETSWVRWLTPYAGPDRGFVFLPELGDEVLIGFEQGDPERPIAIGAAWNGVHTPPAEGFWQQGLNGAEQQANEIKRLVTVSGNRVTLSDHPGKASMAWSTPQHARLLLTEADQETGTPSVALETSGDLVFTAPHGRIHQKSRYNSRDVGKKVAAVVVAAPLPAPFDCKGAWQSAVDHTNAIANMKDPFARNRKISASYADIYLADHDLKWASLGAIVSRKAGCAMADAETERRRAEEALIITPVAGIPMAAAQQGLHAFADANQLIYRTIAPSMYFIAEQKKNGRNGAAELRECIKTRAVAVKDALSDKSVSNERVDNRVIHPKVARAITKLSESEEGAPQKAADILADFEQRTVVQDRIYDKPENQVVFATDQYMAKYRAGRMLGAQKPEIAFVSDCSQGKPIQYEGSILSEDDRMTYYYKTSTELNKVPDSVKNILMSDISRQGQP